MREQSYFSNGYHVGVTVAITLWLQGHCKLHLSDVWHRLSHEFFWINFVQFNLYIFLSLMQLNIGNETFKVLQVRFATLTTLLFSLPLIKWWNSCLLSSGLAMLYEIISRSTKFSGIFCFLQFKNIWSFQIAFVLIIILIKMI